MLWQQVVLLNTEKTYQLLAGGSIGHPPDTISPRLARRLWLWSELTVFFIGVPLGMRWAIYDLHIPLVFVLQPILLGCIAYLLWDDTFHVRREFLRGFALRHIGWILLTFAVIGSAITYATHVVHPSLFLNMPRYHPNLWLLVLLLYPLMSVIPQEMVYRTFFFHRYGPLFENQRWAAVMTNAALFGFAHIIFNNWIAVVGSALVGGLIAYRYWMTRSFWAAWIEHSLYGCLIFTVGLGMYFFTGVSNL